MKENYDQLAEILMKDEWFTKNEFNSTMNSIDLLGLPTLEDVQSQLESRPSTVSFCTAPAGTFCTFDCENCPCNFTSIEPEYHFINSPSAEKCREQIHILKYFHFF